MVSMETCNSSNSRIQCWVSGDAVDKFSVSRSNDHEEKKEATVEKQRRQVSLRFEFLSWNFYEQERRFETPWFGTRP